MELESFASPRPMATAALGNTGRRGVLSELETYISPRPSCAPTHAAGSRGGAKKGSGGSGGGGGFGAQAQRLTGCPRRAARLRQDRSDSSSARTAPAFSRSELRVVLSDAPAPTLPSRTPSPPHTHTSTASCARAPLPALLLLSGGGRVREPDVRRTRAGHGDDATQGSPANKAGRLLSGRGFDLVHGFEELSTHHGVTKARQARWPAPPTPSHVAVCSAGRRHIVEAVRSHAPPPSPPRLQKFRRSGNALRFVSKFTHASEAARPPTMAPQSTLALCAPLS